MLATGASYGALLGLGGCFTTQPPPGCIDLGLLTDPNAPLTIDTHGHVFNGSDLQVKAVFTRVLVPRYPILHRLGQILERLSLTRVPNAQQELGVLADIRRRLRSCTDPGEGADALLASAPFRSIFRQHREQQYLVAREDLIRAANATLAAVPAAADEFDAAVATILDLPDSYDAYVADLEEGAAAAADAGIAGISVQGAVDFLIRNFQYRYTNTFDYLYQYSSGPGRRIDLLAAHLVDYDWPIAGGLETPSLIGDQIEVMAEIARLTHGMVHYFVPFDPMKQVAFDRGLLRGTSPIERIREAADSGAIGVKLYPPIGFALWNNQILPDDFWRGRPWVPRRLLDLFPSGGFGLALDGAMSRLYVLCGELGLPIMAHTNASMGPEDGTLDEDHPDQFRYLTHPRFLESLPYTGLRIDFGHFGGGPVASGADPDNQVAAFARMMTSQSGSRGEFFYGDLGDDDRAVTDRARFAAAIGRLYAAHPGTDGVHAAVADRMMYGSDWFMLAFDGPKIARDFLKAYEAVFRDLDAMPGPPVSDRFFGANAARFLGLRTGEPNRLRLDAFHAGTVPPWRAKVDRL